jgi:chaperonin GroES
MQGKLLGDKVLIKIEEAQEVKKGGIIIPDSAKEKPQEGKIILIGPGRKTDDGKIVPMEVKIGDVVLYEKYAGKEIKIDGQEYVIIGQDDILLVK